MLHVLLWDNTIMMSDLYNRKLLCALLMSVARTTFLTSTILVSYISFHNNCVT